MTKSARKNRLSKKQTKPRKQKILSPAKQQIKKKFVVFAIVAILAAIPFGLGKYIEFNSPGAFDSGSYVYSAKHILDGAGMGTEEKPGAELGTLVVNIVGVWLSGYNEIGPKSMQMILQAAALVLMFIAMRKLFGTLPAAVAVIVASIYLSAPLIAKFGNVKEQYMIALAVMAISSLVLRQLGGGWWYAVLAGALAAWTPLFKQTGVSIIGAIGLFVLTQLILRHRTWKQTAADIGLLLTGAAVSLAPLLIWLAAERAPIIYWPYATLIRLFVPIEGVKVSTYISKARQLHGFSTQWPRVIRYYSLLILPIALATGSIITRISRIILSSLGKLKEEQKKNYDRFVLLFALWWLLDMALVWVSPRSYEQYYLPLNASAAMLGGYLIAVYADKLRSIPDNCHRDKTKWRLIGLAAFICMIAMSWHIFFGIEKSPHSGKDYGRKRRGYAQKLNEISRRRCDNLKGPWETVGEYIRLHSEPTDKIYIWGWYPGIYVKAQRLSPATHAFMSEMHTKTLEALNELIATLLAEFEQDPPKFIVDSRKIHFPWNRPPLELWPQTPKGFLPPDKAAIAVYDKWWTQVLRTNKRFKEFGEDEAQRYEAMQPFREFVMKNYKIVQPFGQHVLFQLKDPAANKGLQ